MTDGGGMLRLWRTVRHLRGRQLVGQLRQRLRPLWENPAAFQRRRAPAFPGCRWPGGVEFLAPGAQVNTAADLLRGQFTFLNSPQELGWPPRWDAADRPKLWQYNLHYFEFLWALDYAAARDVAGDWIARHDLRKGRVGWEPYPVSLRLQNWCAVFFGRFRREIEADDEFLAELWRSIYPQAEWLSRHLETHLLGNHLLENATALAFAGSCFEGRAAARWLRRGKAVLADELLEQILPDGMHFERSPMYHARAVYLLRLLLDLDRADLRVLAEGRLSRIAPALERLRHPDGQIALLNDSAFGSANHPAELLGASAEMSAGAWALPDAGYYGYRGPAGDYIICDAGPIGPDYLPGHAHGDMFSFELSLSGQRVIVDSGVCDYETGESRRYCRSTAAHNTVEVEGQDQCEFWGAFRVARRGRPRDVVWEPADQGFRLSGWHDGYGRLPGRPRHEREFVWRADGGLHVRDRVASSRPVRAVSRLHLHPACRVEKMEIRRVELAHPAGKLSVSFEGPGELARAEAVYCPEFGRQCVNTVLSFSFSGSNPEAGFRIEPG